MLFDPCPERDSPSGKYVSSLERRQQDVMSLGPVGTATILHTFLQSLSTRSSLCVPMVTSGLGTSTDLTSLASARTPHIGKRHQHNLLQSACQCYVATNMQYWHCSRENDYLHHRYTRMLGRPRMKRNSGNKESEGERQQADCVWHRLEARWVNTRSQMHKKQATLLQKRKLFTHHQRRRATECCFAIGHAPQERTLVVELLQIISWP